MDIDWSKLNGLTVTINESPYKGVIMGEIKDYLVVVFPSETGAEISKPGLLLSKIFIKKHAEQECHTPDCRLHSIIKQIKDIKGTQR